MRVYVYQEQSDALICTRIIEEYISLIWSEEWRGSGSMEIKLPFDSELFNTLTFSTYFMIEHSVSRQCCRIESVSVKETSQGAVMIITGLDLGVMFSWRIMVDPEQRVGKASAGGPWTKYGSSDAKTFSGWVQCLEDTWDKLPFSDVVDYSRSLTTIQGLYRRVFVPSAYRHTAQSQLRYYGATPTSSKELDFSGMNGKTFADGLEIVCDAYKYGYCIRANETANPTILSGFTSYYIRGISHYMSQTLPDNAFAVDFDELTYSISHLPPPTPIAKAYTEKYTKTSGVTSDTNTYDQYYHIWDHLNWDPKEAPSKQYARREVGVSDFDLKQNDDVVNSNRSPLDEKSLKTRYRDMINARYPSTYSWYEGRLRVSNGGITSPQFSTSLVYGTDYYIGDQVSFVSPITGIIITGIVTGATWTFDDSGETFTPNVSIESAYLNTQYMYGA